MPNPEVINCDCLGCVSPSMFELRLLLEPNQPDRQESWQIKIKARLFPCRQHLNEAIDKIRQFALGLQEILILLEMPTKIVLLQITVDDDSFKSKAEKIPLSP